VARLEKQAIGNHDYVEQRGSIVHCECRQVAVHVTSAPPEPLTAYLYD
jgi:hypothetical protein